MNDISRRRVLASGAVVAGGLVLNACSSSGSSDKQSEKSSPSNKYASGAAGLFAADAFNAEALAGLGAAGYRTSDVGEVLMTVNAIKGKTGNPSELDTSAYGAYVEEFEARAAELGKRAKNSADSGQTVSARDQYLRSSLYYTKALFFVLGTSKPDREEGLFNATDTAWKNALRFWKPTPESLTISGDGFEMPAWLFSPGTGGEPKRTMILNNGSDGQNIEMVQYGLSAALERDYNVLVFEGPGQGSLLFQQQIPFRADWENVIQPIVEVLKTIPQVDASHISLVGISFGGMLCAAAAAKVDGLSAIVLEPAAVEFPGLWGDPSDFKQIAELKDAPQAERDKAKEEFNKGFANAWPKLPAEAKFTVHKRGEIFTKGVLADARAGKPVSDYFGLLEAISAFDYTDDYKEITIPTLVTHNEGDEFFGDQSKQAFGLLVKVPAEDKELLELTVAEGAQLHDQPMGPQIAQELIFAWLSKHG